MKSTILFLLLFDAQYLFAQSPDAIERLFQDQRNNTPVLHLKDLQFIYKNNLEESTKYLATKRGEWKIDDTFNGENFHIWSPHKGYALNITQTIYDAYESYVALDMNASYTFQTIGGEILNDISLAKMKQIGNTHSYTDGVYVVQYREDVYRGLSRLTIVFAKKEYFNTH